MISHAMQPSNAPADNLAWKNALMSGSRQLLAEGYLARFRARVAEVLESDAGLRSAPNLDAAAILAIFRQRGLIDNVVFECCAEGRHGRLPLTEGLAVCFGAALYPRRATEFTPKGAMAAQVARVIEAVEKDRIEAIVRTFLPAPAPALLARQVARVLCWIAGDSRVAEVHSRQSVQDVFRRKALIPPCLVGRLLKHQHRTGMDAELLALCFAACTFPERAFQMDTTVEIPARADAFIEVLDFLRSDSAAADLAAIDLAERLLTNRGVLPQELASSSRVRLLEDLSASEAIENDWLGTIARADRRNGAALFLATSRADRTPRLLANWQQEGEFLQTLRDRICITPLDFARQVSSLRQRPEWEGVKEEASKALESVPGPHLDSAIVLTQMAWNKVSALRLDMPSDHVSDFWSVQMAKLSSGFPYFAFLSRFTFWWRQCLFTHSFRRSDAELPDDDTLGAGIPAEAGLSLDFLRSVRESYRLVRTTFFRRADCRSASAGEPEDAAGDNEQVRRALDALWYERLQRLDQDEEDPEMVKDIARRFPDLDLQTIANLSHRLPIRMQACVLARRFHLSNAEILSFKKSSRTETGEPVDEFPYRSESGFLPITSIIRGLPLERSLLWAFASHAVLFPAVVPQRPDPWTLTRLLRELWFWLDPPPPEGPPPAAASPPTLSPLRAEASNSATGIAPRVEPSAPCVTRTGVQAHTAAPEPMPVVPWDELPAQGARAAAALRDDPRLRETLLDLLRCTDPAQVEAWQPPVSSAALEPLVCQLLATFPGEDPLRLFRKQALTELRRACAQANHWIVPVWYYRFVEGKAEGSFASFLGNEPASVPKLNGLTRAMRALIGPTQPQDRP
jgi:hypothetical protein